VRRQQQQGSNRMALTFLQQRSRNGGNRCAESMQTWPVLAATVGWSQPPVGASSIASNACWTCWLVLSSRA
jgi:hypothetical protein